MSTAQMEASAGVRRRYEQLPVRIFPDQPSLAAAAAADAAAIIGAAVRARGVANVMVATGNAALQFMAALRQRQDVDWARVALFHLDEYIGLPATHPASFRLFIRTNLADWVQPGAAHYLEGDAADPQAECRRYGALIRSHPIDLCHCGIGENGHLAFNDPGVADFNDPATVRIVELEPACRRQQVGEGHFKTLAAVPAHALTVTIPAMLSAHHIICVAPEKRKAQAIRDALLGPLATSCPASILRRLRRAVLYLDGDSASLL